MIQKANRSQSPSSRPTSSYSVNPIEKIPILNLNQSAFRQSYSSSKLERDETPQSPRRNSVEIQEDFQLDSNSKVGIYGSTYGMKNTRNPVMSNSYASTFV
jgi:hypothetical protein